MKIKIKSVKQINNEIEEIFTNVKSKSELIQRIKDFVNNITGKEMISKDHIITSLSVRLLKYDYQHSTKLLKSKELYDVLHLELYQRTKKIFSKIADSNPFNILLSFDKEMPFIARYIFEYVLFEKGKEWVTFEDRRNKYFDLLKNDKTFKKIHNFVLRNRDAEKLIEKTSDHKVKLIISGLINKGIAPLSSLFYFFDKDKTIKENTEYFYRLVGERYSRNTIQMAISRELNNIKKGKYQVYDII